MMSRDTTKLRAELADIGKAVADAYTLLEHASKYLCEVSAHIEELRAEIDEHS